LGLSTVLGLVKNHGGFVNVDSEVGRGTQFTVYLPAVSSTIALAADAPTILTGHQELILIVDDEPLIQEVARTILEEHNYQTLTVSSGAEAVEIYARHHRDIQVVLMDMMMPVMDGFTAVRVLQQLNPHLKTIISSGLVSSDRVAQFTDIGVRAFLAKPYTATELLDTLQRVLMG
jgi:CheY-like chemotaxis protein